MSALIEMAMHVASIGVDAAKATVTWYLLIFFLVDNISTQDDCKIYGLYIHDDKGLVVMS